MSSDPGIDLRCVGVPIPGIADAPREHLAGCQGVAGDILVEIIAAYAFEIIESGFNEGKIGRVFKAVGPIIGRVVVECTMTPRAQGTLLTRTYQVMATLSEGFRDERAGIASGGNDRGAFRMGSASGSPA